MREAGKDFDVRNRTRRNVQQNENWSFAEQKAPGKFQTFTASWPKAQQQWPFLSFYFRD